VFSIVSYIIHVNKLYSYSK